MITTLIFDWGGVLTVGRHTAAIIKILEKEYDRNLNDEYDIIDGSINLLDLAEINSKEFCLRMKEADIEINEEKMSNVFADAINHNQDIIDLIKKLRKNYKIILLSNNNLPTVNALKSNHKQVLDLFDKIYFSFELKISKPDRRFFEHVVKDANLNVDECLFIDDKEKNIKASEEFGIKGIVFENCKQLEKELVSLGISVK
ncbi:HAD family phosphatase [Candidatus Woesearchaeota archaeon]|nr:HAD family phosphatase [Candidatus Woesearchaeota archaeon]